MRVISTPVTAPRPATRRLRSLDLELLGLLGSAVILTLGVVLSLAGKIGRLPDIAPSDAIVPLHALTGPAHLEPLLQMYDPPERQAVARALYHRASGAEPRLEHVGGLASVTLPASEIRANRGLVQLTARLARRPDASAVVVLSSADLSSIKPRLAVRSVRTFVTRTAWALGSVLFAFGAAHAIRRWRRRDDDPILLPAIMLLCGVGMMTMIALRDPIRDTMAIGTFAGGIAAGLFVLLVTSELDLEASPLRRAVLLPLAAAIGLAMALLVFGSGPGSSGVKVNLFGGQPVEAIRLLVVFALAAYFGRRIELLRALSEPATPDRPWLRYLRFPRWVDIRPVLASMALVLVFFFFQRDLGPALVLTCVFLALYGIGRGHVAFVLVGFALLITGFAVAYWLGEPATVRQRVMIWSDPWNNGVPGGNQIAHGLWALATGAIWGSGPGLGHPQAIPAGHTDFVLAAVGEELGFLGLAAIVLVYGVIGWRCLRVAVRAPGDYTAFLAVGVALGLVVQALVIAGGLLGLVPLSGVVSPFLSFGRSSMIANCFAVGVVLAIARRRGAPREHLRAPIRALSGVLAAAALVVVARAGWVQVIRADELASTASLSEQADGGYRFEHNPRLLEAARTLPRGTIYDRNGLPLATSRPDEMAALGTIYRRAGIVPVRECDAAKTRCYPLGGSTFHLLGDWNHQANWAARNSSYVERDADAELKGYDDRARTIDVENPRTGRTQPAIARDYRELLPLVRQRYWWKSAAIAALRARDRDVHTSIDARLQLRASTELRDRITTGDHARGAVVILDPSSGELLASASYPWPSSGALEDPERAGGVRDAQPDPWLDRARYGLYPPGSVFKLLIGSAALRANLEETTFGCVRLPDGRVGNRIHGTGRPVRDDPKDTVPHGTLDLHRGLVVSCNAYFAQLAQRLGPEALLDAAAVFQIDVSRPATPSALRETLAHAGYGQGQVVVSPLKVARLSASIASGGLMRPVSWLKAGPESASEARRFLTAADAARLGRAMREVVTAGTGRSLGSLPVAMAGKTGTAEVDGAAAHSWFTGFAPYGGQRRIAIAVLVENAGYGARAAAPIAGNLAMAAKEFGLIE